MSVLTIVIVLIVVGVLLYLVNSYLPMDARIKKILNIVVLIIVVVWLIKALGIWAYLSEARI